MLKKIQISAGLIALSSAVFLATATQPAEARESSLRPPGGPGRLGDRGDEPIDSTTVGDSTGSTCVGTGISKCHDVPVLFEEDGDSYGIAYWAGDTSFNVSHCLNKDLQSIRVGDPTGGLLTTINLTSPVNADGGTCTFRYPDHQGSSSYDGSVFEETDDSGTMVYYEAENTTQDRATSAGTGSHDYTLHSSDPDCPVQDDDHEGTWTLDLETFGPILWDVPFSGSTDVTVEVCFVY